MERSDNQDRDLQLGFGGGGAHEKYSVGNMVSGQTDQACREAMGGKASRKEAGSWGTGGGYQAADNPTSSSEAK